MFINASIFACISRTIPFPLLQVIFVRQESMAIDSFYEWIPHSTSFDVFIWAPFYIWSLIVRSSHLEHMKADSISIFWESEESNLFSFSTEHFHFHLDPTISVLVSDFRGNFVGRERDLFHHHSCRISYHSYLMYATYNGKYIRQSGTHGLCGNNASVDRRK